MANKTVNMRKVRESLRLEVEHGLSNRKAAKAIRVGKAAVGEYIAGFNKSELTITQVMNFDFYLSVYN